MIARPQAKPTDATNQDVIDAPPHKVAEIVAGELHLSPRPAAPHAVACTEMGSDLGPLFGRGRGGPGGWHILFEPELHLETDVLVPDLAGWRRERMPRVPNVPFFTLAPDWVCEVASPATARLDRLRKMPIYLREQVAFAWIVDPLQRTVEAYRHGGEHWHLVGVWGDEKEARVPPFDAVPLDVTAWWLEEEPPAEPEVK